MFRPGQAVKRRHKQADEKLTMLALAPVLGARCAYVRHGYSRSSFYRIKRLYERGGVSALQDQRRGRLMSKNRVAPEIAQAIMAFAAQQPTYGEKRVAAELVKRGLSVSPKGVRQVWRRHNLQTAKKRAGLCT